MKFIGLPVLIMAFSGGAQNPAVAQEQPAMMQKSQSGVALDSHLEWNMCEPDGIALGGYDPVSYRQADGPLAGLAEFSFKYAGASYRFVSETNLDAFRADPHKYLPAYGGFCAITLALGRVTCPEYTNFKIEDDRLLLFEVTGFTNGRTLWNSDPEDFRQKADNNFDTLVESR